MGEGWKERERGQEQMRRWREEIEWEEGGEGPRGKGGESIFSSYTATIFKPTQQNSSGQLRVGRFGLEIWNIGDDTIISMEIAVSSISNKVLQLHLVQGLGRGKRERKWART